MSAWTTSTLSDDAMTKILGIEALIDYKFTSRLLLWEALQASGSPVRTIGDRSLGTDGNKSLAIVGDRILDTVLSLDWRNSRTHKANFDRGRQSVADNVNLDNVGKRVGLQDFINKSPGQLSVAKQTMSATVEAILGAVFLDSGGLDAVGNVMDILGLVANW